MIDLGNIREKYPALQRRVGGKPIIYLDSASTAFKPISVINAVSQCYTQGLGNVGRGVHLLAEEASDAYDQARRQVADFLNAEPDEIFFCNNSTEAINIIAASLPSGSNVLTSVAEHHSNMLPWRARHQWTPVDVLADSQIDLRSWSNQLSTAEFALCAMSHVSNATGCLQPLPDLIAAAQSYGSLTLVDASQSVGHFPINVRELDCDFLCFSGHKIGGPTGIGVCFVNQRSVELLRPTKFGGGMVGDVDVHTFSLAEYPSRMEAGTPSIEAAVGLAAACEHLEQIGMEAVRNHEHQLTKFAMEGLSQIKRVSLVGPASEFPRGPIVSFQIEGIEAHGMARLLSSRFNIMVRSGFHCTQPLHQALGWRPTIRASFAVYNNIEDIRELIEAVRLLCKV